MATALTTSWQTIPHDEPNTSSFTYSGYTYNLSLTVQARYEMINSTPRIHARLIFNKTGSYSWSGTNKHYRLRFANHSGDAADSGYNQDSRTWAAGDVSYTLVSDVYLDVTAGTTYNLWDYYLVDVASSSQIQSSVSVYVPVAPTKPTVSASTSSTSGISVTYGTTSFGTPNSGTIRLYGGTSSAPTTQLTSKTTTGNSSYSHTGLASNTKYYYRARATNSASLNSDYSTETSAVTKAPATTLSVASATSNSLTINYSSPADGGALAKAIQYSLDGGSTWVSGAAFTGGNARTGSFVISGLNPATTYTIQNRVYTTAGTTAGTAITGTTLGPQTPTLSIANSGSVYSTQTITYGTTSFNGGTNGVVTLYGGGAADPTTLLTTKTTTGNSTFDNTGLLANKRYYYRSRAGAVFGSGKNFFLVPDSISGKSGTNSFSITATSGAAPSTRLDRINFTLVPNTQYTLSFNVSISGSTMNRAGQVRLNKDGSWTTTWDEGTHKLTFTTGSTGEVGFGFYAYFNDSTGGSTTVTWTKIQLEKGGSATSYVAHNVDYAWSGYVSKNLTTRPPVPTFNSATFLSYESISKVKVRLSVTTKVDEGEFPNGTLQWRYSTDGGSTFTSWTNGPTFTTTTQTNLTVDIPNLDVNTTYRFSVRVSNGNTTSNTTVKDLTTPAAHKGPTNFNWTLKDNNSSLQTWISQFSGYTDPVFIQGRSRAKIIIPRSTQGTPSDGTTLVKYVSQIPSEGSTTLTINWASGTGDMNGLYAAGVPSVRPTDFPSNTITVSTTVYDSLNASITVKKFVLLLSYQAPTITASAERLSTLGQVLVRFSGSIARLQDNSLNSGNDMNNLYLKYRILDSDDNVVVDWTTIPTPTMTIDTNKPFLKKFSGNITLSNVPYSESLLLQVRAADSQTNTIADVPLELWDASKVLYPPDYEIELWKWTPGSSNTATFVADISYLVVGPLNIVWTLNDAEEVSFDIDLERFEKKCQEMGVDSTTLLAPYSHDIRIRRNGEYILGCQLVEANIQINNNPPNKIQIKGTGFLNLFKDQYIINEAWSGYTYSYMARKLAATAESPSCLIKNPTLDIDTSYWLASDGFITSATGAYSGARCIKGDRSGNGWIIYGTQMEIESGTNISINVRVRGPSGLTVYIGEREYITQSSNQHVFTSATLTGGWQQITVSSVKTIFENGYLYVAVNRTSGSMGLFTDECRVYEVADTYTNLHVTIGTDTATSVQDNTRQMSYELQNVKDGIIALTCMEEDNFDFDFSYDRKFNLYASKGSNKMNLDISYPGNVDSMTITRSASNLANKVIALGSGIGDEKLQTRLWNTPSMRDYGCHQTITTDSNVSLKSTLIDKAIGTLYDRKDPTNLPSIRIKDGSINPSNVQTGDTIALSVDGENFIKTATGEYRIQKIALQLGENGTEDMTLTVEPPVQRPSKFMVRYIKDVMSGNSVNNGNHWVEVEALMLVGNDYVNVALNKTVTTTSGSGGTNLSYVTDGDLTSSHYGSSGNGIVIDLGAEYPIDYIRVWHYWPDGRKYYAETLSVGPTLTSGTTSLAKVLWSYSGQNGYTETANGRKSGWIQASNVMNG